MDQRLLHDCAKASAMAFCDSMFSERDQAWRDMYRVVYPYTRAAIESYVEFSEKPGSRLVAMG